MEHKKSSAVRFSLWLEPSEVKTVILRKQITELSETYQTPIFHPHLTLLSGEFLATSFQARFLANYRPFSLNVSGLGDSPQFFQSVFLKLEESQILKKLRNHCIQSFQISKIHKTPPHLSLLYGEFVKKEREDIIKNLNLKLPKKIEFNNLSLSLTEGVVEEWKILKKIVLS